MLPRFPAAFSSPPPLLAAAACFLLVSTGGGGGHHLVVSASITICSRPSAWSLHDLVSQLSAHLGDDSLLTSSSSSLTLLNSTNSSSSSTNSSQPLQLLNLQLVSRNSSLPEKYLSLPISSNSSSTSQFSRAIFPSDQQVEEAAGNGNVTLLVLTSSSFSSSASSGRHRLGSTDDHQQLLNLEAIYQTLRGVHLTSLRFVLLNSKGSFDPAWVAATRKRVSFEVYQELPAGAAGSGSLLDGRPGDIFIYDRCGFLTYYIPFPLSFIHTQQPILQAALLATYFDSPCRAKCNSTSSSSASASSASTVTPTPVGLNVTTEEAAASVVTTTTTTPSSVVATTEAAAAEASTEYSFSSSSSSFFNDSLLPMVNLTAEQAGNFNDMGQILMKFFGQIAAEQAEGGSSSNPSTNSAPEAVAPGQTAASSVESTGNTTQLANSSTLLAATSTTSTNSSNLSVLDRLRGSQRPRLEVTTCTATVCNEWSTERLLKARLCCLNSPESGESSSASAVVEANSTTIVATSTTSLAASNASATFNSSASSTSSSSGSFGCTLYARKAQCSQIMPVIRCCLRKVLNKYFDFTIRLRQQQQRSQLAAGGSEGRQLGSLTVDSSAGALPSTSSSTLVAANGGGTVGGGSTVGARDHQAVHHQLEYPADYVLGGVQQSDYLKQQHRKRVNRRVMREGGVMKRRRR